MIKRVINTTIILGLVVSLIVFFQQKSFASPTAEDIDQITKLVQCIEKKDISCVSVALSSGASPDLQNENTSITILMYAISNYYNDEITSLLIDSAILLNAQDKKGATALIRAVVNPDALNTVEKLLDKGADPNLRRNDDVTALMIAVQINSLPIVKALLAKGADPNLENNDGVTALAIAMERKYHNIVKELIKAKAKPGIAQKRLFYNLQRFVGAEIYNVGKYKRTDIFKVFFKNAKGHCAGLSYLWLYSKWASKNSPEDHNYTWFLSTTKDISSWDGESLLDNKDSDNFNDFLDIVTLFHEPGSHGLNISQTNFKKLLEKSSLRTYGFELNKEYTIASTVTLEQLKELLRKIVNENKLVYLAILEPTNHASALYKDDGIYYFYDPNAFDGEFVTPSVEEIVKKIHTSFNFAGSITNPTIGFAVYGFRKEDQYDAFSIARPPISPIFFKDQAEESSYFPTHPVYWNNDSYIFVPKHQSPKEILDELEVFISEKPLFPAAYIDCPNSTDYFLDKLDKAAINNATLGNKKDTPLILAASYGHLDTLRSYIGKVNLDSQNSLGLTAIMCASRLGFVDIVDELLSFDADANIEDNNKETALIHAVMCGYDRIVEKLIDSGDADKNHQNRDGYTALIIAANKGHIQTVNNLLEKGANPNITAKDGTSALIEVIIKGHIDIVMKLLASCADPNLQRNDGVTALMVAAQKGYTDLVLELLIKCADPKLIANIGKRNITASDLTRDPAILSLLSSTAICIS